MWFKWGFLKEVIFEQKPEGSEGASSEDSQGQSMPAKGEEQGEDSEEESTWCVSDLQKELSE